MTEGEAYTKWCPFMMTAPTIRGEIAEDDLEAGDPISAGHCCIGSMCMGWRWQDPGLGDGYCGLAGKPGPAECEG